MQILFKISILFLLFVIIIDLLFYVPLDFHILFYKNDIYIYLYTFPLIIQTNIRKINRLKNKISIEKIMNAKKEDLQIIKSISLKKIKININKDKNIEKIYYIYALSGFINSLNKTIENTDMLINVLNDKETYLYLKIKVQIVNVFYELIKIRRLKRERASNKRNSKKFFTKH